MSFKFIPKILMTKECIHFFGPFCRVGNNRVANTAGTSHLPLVAEHVSFSVNSLLRHSRYVFMYVDVSRRYGTGSSFQKPGRHARQATALHFLI